MHTACTYLSACTDCLRSTFGICTTPVSPLLRLLPAPLPLCCALLYYVDEATDVTINLKDFKAMLSLCENLGTHIRLWFDGPGNPLVAEPSFPHAHGQVCQQIWGAGAGEGRWQRADQSPACTRCLQ